MTALTDLVLAVLAVLGDELAFDVDFVVHFEAHKKLCAWSFQHYNVRVFGNGSFSKNATLSCWKHILSRLSHKNNI